MALLKRPTADGKTCGIGPDGPQPSDRGEWLKQCVQGWRSRPQSSLLASGSLRCAGPREWIVSDHLLSTVDDTLQSALVLGSSSNVPDGEGGGEDGGEDGALLCRSAPSLSLAG